MPTKPAKVTVKSGTGTKKSTAKPAASRSAGGRAKKDAVMELTHSFENETPGTFRFGEDADKDDQAVPTVYIKKDKAVEVFGKQPKGIKVTITPVF